MSYRSRKRLGNGAWGEAWDELSGMIRTDYKRCMIQIFDQNRLIVMLVAKLYVLSLR